MKQSKVQEGWCKCQFREFSFAHVCMHISISENRRLDVLIDFFMEELRQNLDHLFEKEYTGNAAENNFLVTMAGIASFRSSCGSGRNYGVDEDQYDL